MKRKLWDDVAHNKTNMRSYDSLVFTIDLEWDKNVRREVYEDFWLPQPAPPHGRFPEGVGFHVSSNNKLSMDVPGKWEQEQEPKILDTWITTALKSHFLQHFERKRAGEMLIFLPLQDKVSVVTACAEICPSILLTLLPWTSLHWCYVLTLRSS